MRWSALPGTDRTRQALPAMSFPGRRESIRVADLHEPMTPLTEFIGWCLTRFTRIVTGAQARWVGCAPLPVQRIYFGNHSSHADFALIWASLPAELRKRTRPVAGADYWEKGALRRFLIHEVLNG